MNTIVLLFRMLFTYKYQGLKEFSKLQLNRVPYIKFKDDKTITIYIPNYKQPIFLRRYTSDYPTFKQIFDAKEYAINYPFKPKIIIDAGANIGLAAVYYTNRFPTAKIYSIEPEASNISVLQKNIKSYKQVTCLPMALHHTENEILQIVDQGIGNWGFVTKAETEVTDVKTIVSSVKTISIPSLMQMHRITIIDILKIDIEGAEMALFEKNYQSWLPKTRCLIIELHDRYFPGCEEQVFNVIDKFHFSHFRNGEFWVFMNEDKKGLKE